MKKLLIGILLCLPTAFAYDSELIDNSSAALAGALSGVFQTDAVYTNYLPGYGLQIEAKGSAHNDPLNDVLAKVEEVMSSLSGMVKGLEPTDRIIFTHYDYFDTERHELIVILKPSEPSQFEVWLDGQKR